MTDPYKTAGSLAVAEERRVLVIEAAERPQDLQLRVAAYTRVSSDSEDQLNSFTAQNRYYTALISSKENWTMVDVYADRGETGGFPAPARGLPQGADRPGTLQIHLAVRTEYNRVSGGYPRVEVLGNRDHL